MRAAVLINHTAGTSAPSGQNPVSQLRKLFEQAGVDASITTVEPGRLKETARAALKSGADVIVAGGGDGTVSSVAELLAGTQTPLGILPLGTRNHLARDLGIPIFIEAAVETISRGAVRTIDLGEVNGQVFVNNSSIGAYPRIVEERDAAMHRRGWNKHFAALVATWRVFSRFPLIRVHLEMDGKSIVRTTPFVFVGNNHYSVSLFNVSLRPCLNAGQLCVYTARCTGLLCLFRLLVASSANRLQQARDFESHSVGALRLALPKKHVRVSMDGEVVRMTSPLNYRIRPGALRVLAGPHAS